MDNLKNLISDVVLKKMSSIPEYFIPVDSVRCQCVFCGKCFTLNSPLDIREKHLESEHPQGFSKIKSAAITDKPSNQGYTSEKEISSLNRSTRKKRSKVWYYFKRNADKTGNICNICSKTLSGTRTTGQMLKHLINVHNIKKEKLLWDKEILDLKVENPVELRSDKSPNKLIFSRENRAFIDLYKEKPFENISEYILKSDIRSTRNISNVRIFCLDGVVSTHKILLASISNFLSDLLKENNDNSDIILPDFNMKDVLLGFENLVSQNDFQTSSEILKLLLGRKASIH